MKPVSVIQLENRIMTGLQSLNGSPNKKIYPTKSTNYQTQTSRQQYNLNPTPKPFKVQLNSENSNIGCGVSANSFQSLVIRGQAASRGKWPW